MTPREIGNIFSDVAVLLELNGDNHFKVRAYESAGRLLAAQTKTTEEVLEEIAEGQLKGIGAGLQAAISEILETGEYSLLIELQQAYPDGFLELLGLSGLGPKKLRVLKEELGIENLEAFIKACEQNRLIEVRGFSEKSQQKLLEAAQSLLLNRKKLLLPNASATAEALEKTILEHGAEKVVVVGEIRRSMPIVSEIDLCLMPGKLKQDLLDRLIHSSGANVRVVKSAETLKITDLLYATGSSEHLRELEATATKAGFQLSAEGFFRGKEAVATESEADFYHTLSLIWIPPELREGRGEVAAAAKLFQSGAESFGLLEEKDLRGVVHSHSTYSDGKNTIKEMALEVQRRGYSYFGLTDHSQSAAYAGGLKVAAIQKQRSEIRVLNEELAPFRIFHGIESDILVDGSLDYPDDVLAGFDFVIASVHSRFSKDEEAMTKRIINAVRNPFTTILGHATGRKLLQREPYSVNLEAVIDAAAETGTAIELNCNPKRLELDWQFLSLAAKRGVLIPICPDAHSISDLGDLHWGVRAARKGGLRPEHVLNTRSADEFAAFCKNRRGH